MGGPRDGVGGASPPPQVSLPFALALMLSGTWGGSCQVKTSNEHRCDAENHRGRKNSLFLPVPPCLPSPGWVAEAAVPPAASRSAASAGAEEAAGRADGSPVAHPAPAGLAGDVG